VKPFTFVGKLAASKSILNRTLLVQTYNPHLRVIGESDSDDVAFMRTGAAQLFTGQDIDAGSAATVLRFLAVRASRIPGRHRLVGHPRLMSRPHDELIKILRQVGVQCEIQPDALVIESAGWKMHGDTILVPSERSSQFASAVLLNAWELPFDLYVSLGGKKVSEGYWRMSVHLAQAFGMKIDFWDSDFRVSGNQKPKGDDYVAEIDMSSAFALAGIAAVNGQATFLDFPEHSIQPDAQFTSILQTMGVPVTWSKQILKVEKARQLGGVAVNLKSSPDLFPVLAALCALAEGESDLFGAPHLVHKESDRLNRLAGWIRELGRVVEVKSDGLVISGEKLNPATSPALTLDCDHDHRLAFAAAVFKAAGFKIQIANGQVVTKSFPKFWDIIGDGT
jgi:3-phosphoshikimate 1-carboxyvinyltransferase